jgi:class 3 adenylate cyclase
MFELSEPRRFEAVVAMLDLENFTSFCTQPDMHLNLGVLLNFSFDRVNDGLYAAGLTRQPRHFKFLGDGALYVWDVDPSTRRDTAKRVVLGLHNLFRVFPHELEIERDLLNLRAPPKRVRVGIAYGEIVELRSKTDGTLECVGFAINLAARLQNFCKEIGFLISSGVPLDAQFIEDYSLVRSKTKGIRGMSGVDEDVWYVKEDADTVSQNILKRSFLFNN